MAKKKTATKTEDKSTEVSMQIDADFIKSQVKQYVEEAIKENITAKTLDITSTKDAKKKVNDIVVVGNGDTMQLLCKASSESQGWMKSAKAMEVKGVGCLVQFTTQQRNIDGTYSIAETSSFLPGTKLRDDVNGGMKVVPQNYNGD